MKRKKETLAGLRREVRMSRGLRGEYANLVYSAKAEARSLRLRLDQVTKQCEHFALQLARSQGYIDRVHVVEGRAELKQVGGNGPLDDDVILRVRDELANGPEKRAHQILDMINPSELLDRATGKMPGEEPQDLEPARGFMTTAEGMFKTDARGDWKAI